MVEALRFSPTTTCSGLGRAAALRDDHRRARGHPGRHPGGPRRHAYRVGAESYAHAKDGELWLVNAYIPRPHPGRPLQP